MYGISVVCSFIWEVSCSNRLNTVPHICHMGLALLSEFSPAFVWFLSCVNPHVSGKASYFTKYLTAQLTYVRFLSCMSSLVSG